MRANVVIAIAIGCLAAPACALRDAPYRFRAPLVTSVRAPELRSSGERARQQGLRAELEGRAARERQRRRQRAFRNLPLDMSDSPLRQPSGDGAPLLRLVGERRDDRLAFVRESLSSIGVRLAPDLDDLPDGDALLLRASERGAVRVDDAALTGDLVVFDQLPDGEAVVGVVAAIEAGTIEFVYAAGGVVRRGVVTPDDPRTARDAGGRTRNTFLRHNQGPAAPSSRLLAGEHLRAIIALERLARR